MASGIEIVGLVLGAIPLATSAMEHYEESKSAAVTFFRVRRAYRKDIRNLKYCQTMLVMHLKELIRPMLLDEVLEGTTLEDLLVSPGGPRWKDDDFSTALATRLDDNHQSYLDTLDELQTALAHLVKATKAEDAQFQRLLASKVEQDRTATVTLMSHANDALNSLTFQPRRMKYSLSSKSREHLLEEVEKYIDKLSKLVTATDRFTATTDYRAQTRRRTVAKATTEFWSHAERMYRLLRHAMKCHCLKMHRASLWLREKTSLDLLLLYSSDAVRTSGPWKSQAIRVGRVKGECSCAVTQGASLNTITIPTPSTQAVARAATSAVSGTPKKSAKFSVPISLPVMPNASALGLCARFESLGGTSSCLGALQDDQEYFEYHVVPYPHTAPIDAVQLSWLLNLNTQVSFPRKQRYIVAARLASAHLQYSNTSWLVDKWSADTICVLRRPSQGGGGDSAYDDPYISTTFEHEPANTSAGVTLDQNFWLLGVILLELCFGRSLETHSLWRDQTFQRDPNDPLQRQAVAFEWAKDAEMEGGRDFSSAIDWCLKHSPSNSNQKWRDDFAENVLQPLRRCCSSLEQ